MNTKIKTQVRKYFSGLKKNLIPEELLNTLTP